VDEPWYKMLQNKMKYDTNARNGIYSDSYEQKNLANNNLAHSIFPSVY
jgi:hypothetical protein